MIDNTMVTARSADRPTQSASRRVSAVAVLVTTFLAGSTAAWAAAQGFPAESSTATWDGQVVSVKFTEVGLAPRALTTIAVDATATVDTSCRQGNSVWLSVHSSATASDVSAYTSDEQGTVAASRKLTLVVQSPVISGLPCTVEVVRTLTVTLRDLDSKAFFVIPAQTTHSSTPR